MQTTSSLLLNPSDYTSLLIVGQFVLASIYADDDQTYNTDAMTGKHTPANGTPSTSMEASTRRAA
jgi:hypothetical protein